MDIRIRTARRADLPAVYEVLEAAFTNTPLQLFIDQTEGDSTLRMRHIRVAEVDGRIAAAVRIFARRMLIRGVAVPAGGIGSVASSPDARGLGLPTALLRDADSLMAREGMLISFLFTRIPAFYERLGWRIVQQPAFDRISSVAAASNPHDRSYRTRRIRSGDLPALISIYREAIAGSTGAIVRTPGTWRDAERWLGEDAAGCLIAERDGHAVAYLRARVRDYGYHILEAEHRHGHEGAIAALLARVATRARALEEDLYTTAPDDHALAREIRAMPSAFESPHMRFPTMMRIVSLAGLITALLPHLQQLSASNPGPPFALGLRAPGDQTATLRVGRRSLRITRGDPEYLLDEAATLDALLGQRQAGSLVRPRPPAAIRRRIDALFPRTPFHFWNSSRI